MVSIEEICSRLIQLENEAKGVQQKLNACSGSIKSVANSVPGLVEGDPAGRDASRMLLEASHKISAASNAIRSAQEALMDEVARVRS